MGRVWLLCFLIAIVFWSAMYAVFGEAITLPGFMPKDLGMVLAGASVILLLGAIGRDMRRVGDVAPIEPEEYAPEEYATQAEIVPGFTRVSRQCKRCGAPKTSRTCSYCGT